MTCLCVILEAMAKMTNYVGRYVYSNTSRLIISGTDAPESFDNIEDAIAAADAHPERPGYILDRHDDDGDGYGVMAWREDTGWEYGADRRYDD